MRCGHGSPWGCGGILGPTAAALIWTDLRGRREVTLFHYPCRDSLPVPHRPVDVAAKCRAEAERDAAVERHPASWTA